MNRFTQRVGCYRAHELAHARSEVPSAEIIQPGFAIPFFAGEFVGGAEAASDLFAEGEVVERVKDRLVHGGHEASGAEVVFVDEVRYVVAFLYSASKLPLK